MEGGMNGAFEEALNKNLITSAKALRMKWHSLFRWDNSPKYTANSSK